MKTKIAKWGNSYALRLPKQLIEDLQLEETDELQLESEGDALILRKPSKELQLKELLKDMQPQGGLGCRPWKRELVAGEMLSGSSSRLPEVMSSQAGGLRSCSRRMSTMREQD